MSANVCTICLDAGEPEEIVSSLRSCGHVFHKKCAMEWLNAGGSYRRFGGSSDVLQAECPTCRKLFCEEDVTRIFISFTGSATTTTTAVNSKKAPSSLADSEVYDNDLEEHRVHVKYGDLSVTKQDLEEYFSSFSSNISSIIICRTPEGKPKGYAILAVQNADDAIHLTNRYHNKIWRGCKLQVTEVQSKDQIAKASIFVINLKAGVNEMQLRQAFQVCGKIVRVHVNPLKPGKRSVTAKVQFQQSESASQAILTMHGKQILGSKIYVTEFKSPKPISNILDTRNAPEMALSPKPINPISQLPSKPIDPISRLPSKPINPISHLFNPTDSSSSSRGSVVRSSSYTKTNHHEDMDRGYSYPERSESPGCCLS